MALYFTSDLHFGHESVIGFCNRPFKDLKEMHECLLDNYNSVVTDRDEVWFLGDLVLKAQPNDAVKFYSSLKGKKHVVWGNHDKRYRKYLSGIFETSQDYKELEFDKQKLVLMHFPIHSWNGMRRGSIHLHGHSHGTLKSPGINRVDVGVDVWNYYPINFRDILSSLTDSQPVD